MKKKRRAAPPSPESQLVVILDDDQMVTDALATGLERKGRTVVTCNDLESGQLVVERLRPSHIVSDVRLSGPFGFEGLEFIRFARQYSPESRIVLMTGDAPEALQLEASEQGAAAFLQKPFEIAQLDATLDLLKCSALSPTATDTPVIRMPLLDEILTSGALRSFLQPIVSLRGGGYAAAGYEALMRYRDNVLLRDPELLFHYAARKQRIIDLEAACIAAALKSGSHLPPDQMLFVNIHPHALSNDARLPETLHLDLERTGMDPRRIILEITEQGSLTSGRRLFENIESLRLMGIRFALDDVGVAYSHLPLIDRIGPSFLKISQHFGTSFETDSTKQKIVVNLQSLAADLGSELILEGIETAATAETAARVGISYGQGFLFGRPVDPAALNVDLSQFR